MIRVALLLSMVVSLVVPSAIGVAAAIGALEGAGDSSSPSSRAGSGSSAEPDGEPETETESSPPPESPKRKKKPRPPDHPHGIAPIETAFATLENLGLSDPESRTDAVCYGEGYQKHWYCEVTRKGVKNRYTIHVRPDLGTMSWVTKGDSPRAQVKQSPYTAVLEGITHSHGEGSFKVVKRTMAEYGLDRFAYECWAGAERSAHWKCRDEVGAVYTIHITPEGTPTNYVTDGWDPTTNIIGVDE